MDWLAAFLCSGFLIWCDDNSNVPEVKSPEVFVSAIQPIEPEEMIEEKLIVPHKLSSKISQESWDRAIKLRPLLIDVVEKEFQGDMRWLGVMVALCHTESRCKPSALSPVGAKGVWQWMKSSIVAFAATECRDLPRNRVYTDARDDPIYSAFCASRHLKQNIRIVKKHNTDCDLISVGALRGYNEGPGNTKKAQRMAKDPGDTNSVSLVSWKSKANELQTDQYPVKIMAKWFREYRKSNYFVAPDPCADYKFITHGVQI